MGQEHKDSHLSDLPYALSSPSKREVGQNLSQSSCNTVVGWAVEKCLTPGQRGVTNMCVLASQIMFM